MRRLGSRPRRWAAALCGLIAVLAGEGPGEAAGGRLTVYSALDERVTEELVRAFGAHSGIDTEVLAIGAAGTLAARIRGEPGGSPADVFVGGSADAHASLAAAGLLRPYESPALAGSGIAPAFVDAGGHWHGWYLSTLSIIVNRDRYRTVFASTNPPLPKTWDDLLQPAYRGHLTMPSPVTTGAGYLFVATQVFRLGEEKAFEYLRRVVANAGQVTPTVTLAVQLVARGDAILAVNWSHEALALRGTARTLGVIIPPDTGFEIGCVSIVKGGPNPDGAEAFVDFLLGKAAQELIARVYLRHPTRPDAKPATGIPAMSELGFVDSDRDWAVENKARLQKRWRAEIER